MAPPIVEDNRIAFALHKMDLGGYRHIPILSEGHITGIISARHILRHISAAI
jgi:CBS domain-containing protein